LLLENGVVYVAWGSFADAGPYHGWVLGYNARTLKQVTVFNTAPNGQESSIWMSGAGLAADAAGNIFVAPANGDFDPTQGNYGDSVWKLVPSGGTLNVVDYFTPANQAILEAHDIDFGSGGVLLLPTQAGSVPRELIAAGKDGTIYLVNRDSLG